MHQSLILAEMLLRLEHLKHLLTQAESAACFISQHHVGCWGDVCEEDAAANDQALIDGERIFSVYHTAKGVKLYVITEADRSSTCILLSSEY